MDIFERPILIYSDFCNYSKLFIQNLLQYPDLYESFVRINIDVNPKTNERPKIFYDIQQLLQFKISNVPTIIVQNGEFVLSGKEAFNWLEYQLNELNKLIQQESDQNKTSNNNDGSLQGFNPLEMGSFSDGYAELNQSNPNSQSFQFLNAPLQNISTPEENNENYDKKEHFENDANNYSNFLQKRNNINRIQYQSAEQRPMSHMSKNYDKGNSKMNKKQNEINKKYEELLAEREQSMAKRKSSKRVNFSSGTFE
jgi:hypothetical protein